MRYRELLPPWDLREVIHHFWVLETDTGFGPNSALTRVFPKGTAEWLFPYRGKFRVEELCAPGEDVPLGGFAGPLSGTIHVESDGGTGIFVVKFTATGAARLLNMPLQEMRDRGEPAQDLLGPETERLADAILAGPRLKDRYRAAVRFFRQLLPRMAPTDAAVRLALQRTVLRKGQATVAELADGTALSTRQLERRFAAGVGLTPKQFARIVRFRAVLAHLRATNYSSLTALAYQNGYYDQAHLIRDFRQFAGTSPNGYRKYMMNATAAFARDHPPGAPSA